MSWPGKRVLLGSAIVGGIAVVVGAVTVSMTVWTPTTVLGWVGGIAGAALAAYLSQEGPRQFTSMLTRRKERRRLEGAPFAFTTRLHNLDYVTVTVDGETAEVPASGHTLQIVVTGLSPVPVVVTALHAEVVSRHDRGGDLARHAAEIPLRRFEILLDSDPPLVRTLTSSDFPYRIAKDETEVFDLLVSVEAGDVRWVLWLDWSAGDRSGSTRIDLGGHEFRTAARHTLTTP